MRWTFKLYDASGDGVLEQQEVDDHVHDVHHGDHHVHHDHCDDLFQVLLIMQSIQGAFSREETGISRSFFKWFNASKPLALILDPHISTIILIFNNATKVVFSVTLVKKC